MREKKMEVKDSAGLKSCLRRATVEVRFAPKENSRILDPKHIMYGDMSEDAKITLSVPKLSSGQYVNVLTNDEKEFFEDLFQFSPGTMSIYAKKDNYWDDSNVGFVNTVTLTKRSVFLNLEDPEDYIRYKILLANKDIVAPSLSALKANHKATYQFVLVESKEENEIAKKSLNSTMEAYEKLSKIKDDWDVMRFITETLSKTSYTKGTDIDVFMMKIQEYIQRNPDSFISIVDDPLLEQKVLLKKGVDSGIVFMKGGYFYLTEGSVPLCDKNQEPTLDIAASYIKLPKNQEIVFLIEAKLNR